MVKSARRGLGPSAGFLVGVAGVEGGEILVSPEGATVCAYAPGAADPPSVPIPPATRFTPSPFGPAPMGPPGSAC